MIWFWFPIAVVCAVAGAFFAWRAISLSLDRIFDACPDPRESSQLGGLSGAWPRLAQNPSEPGHAPRSFRSYHRKLRRQQLARDLSPFHKD